MPDAHPAPAIQVRAGLLRLCSKNRVAAANVSHDRMLPPRGVSKLNQMFFARPSAVLVARPSRKKPAEHAMLGVKHRKMLVSNNLQLRPPFDGGEICHLLSIQVV